MSAFTGYKLSRKKKSWPEAENYCKTRGLQLATIHSKWEQELAEKAADGQKVWLGGRKNIREGQWQWIDNTTWDFTNWDYYHPNENVYLIMERDGKWKDLNDTFRRPY